MSLTNEYTIINSELDFSSGLLDSLSYSKRFKNKIHCVHEDTAYYNKGTIQAYINRIQKLLNLLYSNKLISLYEKDYFRAYYKKELKNIVSEPTSDFYPDIEINKIKYFSSLIKNGLEVLTEKSYLHKNNLPLTDTSTYKLKLLKFFWCRKYLEDWLTMETQRKVKLNSNDEKIGVLNIKIDLLKDCKLFIEELQMNKYDQINNEFNDESSKSPQALNIENLKDKLNDLPFPNISDINLLLPDNSKNKAKHRINFNIVYYNRITRIQSYYNKFLKRIFKYLILMSTNELDKDSETLKKLKNICLKLIIEQFEGDQGTKILRDQLIEFISTFKSLCLFKRYRNNEI